MEQMVGIREVARALGLSVAFIEKSVKAGSIPSYRLGRARRFRMSEIEAWLREHREGGQS